MKKNENDTLSYTCLWCDNGQYWRKGTEAHRITLAKIKPLANEEPAANDVPPHVTKTAPAKASAGTLLG